MLAQSSLSSLFPLSCKWDWLQLKVKKVLTEEMDRKPVMMHFLLPFMAQFKPQHRKTWLLSTITCACARHGAVTEESVYFGV